MIIRDINCLTLRCKVPRSLSLYSQPLTPPGTALLQWTGLKRNEPAAALKSSSSYQQLRELSNTDVITMNTFFHTAGINSFSTM